MSVQLLRYADHWLTEEEKVTINQAIQGAIDRLIAKRERNGACPCRCAWPLEDDGSNTCRCCASVDVPMPDDFDPDGYPVE